MPVTGGSCPEDQPSSSSHDRHSLSLPGRRLLRHQRCLREQLRNPLTHPHTMETILVGLIALILLAYLTVAMLRPEKF